MALRQVNPNLNDAKTLSMSGTKMTAVQLLSLQVTVAL
jgi:hypothetical protein